MKNKKILSMVLAISMILVLWKPSFVKAIEPKSKVVITADPGHGPGDPNQGPTGYYEHEGMWKLANFLKAALESNGIEVVLTRTENEDPSLGERGEKAEGSDLFISLHSNAFDQDETIGGTEVYYSVKQPGNEQYAKRLVEETSRVMGNTNRGAKTRESKEYPGQDYYGVIRSAVEAGCPHVYLVENGFHTNPVEEEWLKNDDNLRRLGEAQAKVIMEILDIEVDEEEPEEVEPIDEEEPEEVEPIDEEEPEEVEPIDEEEPEEVEPIDEEEPEEVEPIDEEEPEEVEPIDEDEELNLAIKKAEEAIANLPSLDKLTLEHKDDISYARGLVQAVRELDANVLIKGEEIIGILEAKIAELEEQAKDQEIVNSFIEQINKLPEIDEITLENKEEVEAVRKAYNNLTETQKALVSDEILEKLISAEEKINDLLNKEQEENNIEVENSSSKDKKDDKEKETLPETGNNDDDNNKFYISGILLILLGLSIRRKIN